MANYREHVTVSSLLGVGYGLQGFIGFGFNPVQGILAACLAGLSGMLPDLDSDNGRPVREMFGLLGAIAPLLLVNRVIAALGLAGDPETIMLVIVLLYVAIKYGGAELICRISVHRGMFHSLPALLIASEAVFLAYPSPRMAIKAYMAGAVALGFLSHLLLDELYSVEMKNSRLSLKRSSGTALKWSGEALLPNVMTYTLMATLSYAVFWEAGWFDQQPAVEGSPVRVASPAGAGGTAPADALDPFATDLGAPSPLSTQTAEWELHRFSPHPAADAPAVRLADPATPSRLPR
jgi:membrane-bound metal-dependent hydrolase YbcI (DUF457 family)